MIGHSIKCCSPDECAWCNKPISFGQGLARCTTTIFDDNHDELLEHWRDYHHTPAIYEALQRRSPQIEQLERHEVEGLGGCLWYSEHD